MSLKIRIQAPSRHDFLCLKLDELKMSLRITILKPSPEHFSVQNIIYLQINSHFVFSLFVLYTALEAPIFYIKIKLSIYNQIQMVLQYNTIKISSRH